MEHSIQIPIDAVKAVHNGAGVSVSTALEQYRAALPPEKQLSWLQLGYGKSVILGSLTKRELELQGLLVNYQSDFKPEWNTDEFWATVTSEQKQEVINALIGLQNKLAEYLKGIKDLPEIRKSFTRYLDRIFDELSVVEKRAETYSVFEDAKKLFILIRGHKESNDNIQTNKITEQDRFITFLRNQYIAIASDYRQQLLNMLDQCYIFCLENEKIVDQDTLKAEVVNVWTQMQAIKPDVLERFDYKLHTREEMLALMSSVLPPDYTAILEEAKTQLNTKFQMFWNDRQNKEKAKEFIEKEQAQRNSEIEDTAARQTGVNNLRAYSGGAAGNVTVTDADLKASATKRVMVVEDDNPLWANKVIVAFLANWPVASAFLKIRKWGNLSVSQMAGALDDAKIVVEGVQYQDKTK